MNSNSESKLVEAEKATATVTARPNFPDIETISEADWQLAKRREPVIRSLAYTSSTLKEIKQAAAELGISTRQVYNLMHAYRASEGQFISLLKGKPNGGKGKGRLPQQQEKIIQATIEKLYLTKQRLRPSVIIEEIKRRCHYAAIKSPSDNAIRARIMHLSEKLVLTKRYDAKLAKEKTAAILGQFPESPYPLFTIQMDHTPVDLIIVDEVHRLPIGRPYLTVAIDTHSRCIAGFCLSLEPPSAVSVGLCLVHTVFPKETWLAERNIKTAWLIHGKPENMYVDNATEFHSIALQRGCDAHGIALAYRPIGQPHYGGIVERVIGTLMELVHRLPGTTFSNIQQKANYDAEKKAQFTLAELETWLTIAIVDYYHQKMHRELKMSPIAKYEQGCIIKDMRTSTITSSSLKQPRSFLLDFLPVSSRLLRRDGFTLNGMTYFSPNLQPLIANRKTFGKFLLRRDPRDISRIYVLHPETQVYLEIPCRTLNHPSLTLWEHKACLHYLKQHGEKNINEKKIFQALDEMQMMTREAAAKNKAARRKLERKAQSTDKSLEQNSVNPVKTDKKYKQPINEITLFQETEEW